MTQQYEIDAAYYQGLREGFDPEVAEDLGIPMSPETASQHIESAKEVGNLLLSQTVELSPADIARQNAHKHYVKEFKLTGLPPVRTPEEQAEFDAGLAKAREIAGQAKAHKKSQEN